MSREVLRDAFIYLPAKIIPAFISVIAIPILTYFLSPEQYGQYLLLINTLSLIGALCVSWLVSITIRFNVIYGVNALFHTSRRLLVYSILLACMLWFSASYFLGEVFRSDLFVAAGLLWLISYGGFEYFSCWFRARNLPKPYSFAMSWRSVAGLLCAMFLFYLGFQGGAIVVLGFAIAMIFGLIFLPRQALRVDNNQLKLNESNIDIGELLRYGIPVAISNLFTVGLSIADRYIINILMGAEFVGIYGANYDIAEKTIFFVNSALLLSSSVIGFRIFEQEGDARAADFLSRLMRLYLLAGPLVVVSLSLLSPHIVLILFPEKYQAGALVIPMVAIGGLLVGVMHRYSLVLSFNKRTDIIMYCSISALLVNIISCFLLVPKYGILGAAFGTLISYASWLILICWAASMYSVPLFPRLTFFKVCGALLIAIAAMYSIIYQEFMSNLLTLVSSLLFGFIAYSITLFILKEITTEEVKSIASIISARFRRA